MSQSDFSDDELRARLTPEQYRVLRQKDTEAPGSGQLLNNDAVGEYHCPVCDALLFTSNAKYDSTTPGLTGWPSFSEAANNSALKLVPDNSWGMQRTEVQCATCGSHLGHVFDAPDAPNGGKHYCINSCALDFKPQE